MEREGFSRASVVGGLSEELERVDQPSVGQDLVVEMRACCAAGRSDEADGSAGREGRARLDRRVEVGEVAVGPGEAVDGGDREADPASPRHRQADRLH